MCDTIKRIQTNWALGTAPKDTKLLGEFFGMYWKDNSVGLFSLLAATVEKIPEKNLDELLKKAEELIQNDHGSDDDSDPVQMICCPCCGRKYEEEASA